MYHINQVTHSSLLAPNGIRVNAVAPGVIWTPLQPATKGNSEEDMDGLGLGAPLGRPGVSHVATNT